MTFLNLAKERYSCRQLSDRPVEEEKIEQILKAGQMAPTAVNKQPYRIFRCDSEKAKAAIHQVTNCTFGAETFLIVGGRAEEAWVREFDNKNFVDVDAAIVATHMMMAIKDLGLDTTWVGYFDAPKLKDLLPELAPYNLVAIFPVGYAKEEAKPSDRHEKRRDLSETVITL